MSKYIDWVKKMTCFGVVLEQKEIRDKDNETDLMEGEVIEIENYSASIHYYDNYNLVQ